jgi:hypothetical protein
VAQEKNRATVVAGKVNLEVVAKLMLTVKSWLAAYRLETRCENLAQLIQGGFMVARGLHPDHLTNRFRDVIAALLE